MIATFPRLSDHYRATIRATVREVFGPEVRVWLFGSRVDATARGGDIDLLVESPTPIADRERKTLRCLARLQMRLGEQPIDLLVLDPLVARLPIHAEALRTGLML
ncbi:nucleotidyltransferase domain-containing protein [Hydrogenophilus thiooxidans]|uniref:nucleotidyltransferase domain-containing protein n=1 Tax=Hydrogenophilus thiooxidans TaxID=2820326 RepID=UPI001C219314|nr:nucleotidyltransferase domain-containing protein [Hydrogenophilus thiooxidans]